MMDNLYITNYCDSRCTQFRNITSLSEDDAYKLAEELSQYAGSDFTSFSRFTDSDFDGYYQKRKRTEEWLYSKIFDLGIKPKNKFPLYFVLGESSYLNKWYENGIKTRLMLKNIRPEDISFTFGDSMSRMDSKDRMSPFNIETLTAFIHEKTDDVSSYLAQLDMQNRYIEAQLWNDRYLKGN
ncbi:MAG: hypothetical protein GX321_03015 [Clostridiales bacterium]|nr:hypothetical protein [Clostridiales bacterium]